MTKLSAEQIDYQIAGFLRLGNLATGAANSTVVTTPLTTLLATASRSGGSLPLQVSTSGGPGILTSSPNNLVELNLTSNGDKITDGQGNEVYGRITEASGVYTLRYYSTISGVETAYSHPSTVNIDAIFRYVFDLSQLPVTALVSPGSYVISNDPAGGNQKTVVERPTIATLNTLPALTYTPTDPATVKVVVRGQVLYPGGANPDFTVGGANNRTLTWSAANAGYSLQPGWNVVYEYNRFL